MISWNQIDIFLPRTVCATNRRIKFVMANKKDKMNSQFAFQEEQDANGVIFSNSLNTQKGGYQVPSPTPKNVTPGSKVKARGDKRQLSNRDERLPWKWSPFLGNKGMFHDVVNEEAAQRLVK